jgi:hypothetical protein
MQGRSSYDRDIGGWEEAVTICLGAYVPVVLGSCLRGCCFTSKFRTVTTLVLLTVGYKKVQTCLPVIRRLKASKWSLKYCTVLPSQIGRVYDFIYLPFSCHSISQFIRGENHTEHTNTLCGQNTEFYYVKAGGTYTNH